MKDSDLEKLLKAAGPMVNPSESVQNDVKSAVEAAWLDVVAANKRRERRKKFAIALPFAAAILLAVGLKFGGVPGTNQNNSVLMASMEFQEGSVALNGRLISSSQSLRLGDRLSTLSGRATLRLKDQTVVMLSENTDLYLANDSTLELTKGRLYLDSPDHNTSITIVTPMGNVRDIGTQYEVEVGHDELKVAMRSGKVEMAVQGQLLYAETENQLGDVIIVDSQQRVRSHTIAKSDPHWNWAQEGYADFSVENRSAAELLDWVSGITGKQIIYQSADARQRAQTSVLYGGVVSAKHLDRSLHKLMKVAALNAQIKASEIVVAEEK